MAVEKVWGDEFEILRTGSFKSRPDLTWKLLRAGSSEKRIIIIPRAYGDDKIEYVLKNIFAYDHSKSITFDVYYIYINNINDNAIASTLESY